MVRYKPVITVLDKKISFKYRLFAELGIVFPANGGKHSAFIYFDSLLNNWNYDCINISQPEIIYNLRQQMYYNIKSSVPTDLSSFSCEYSEEVYYNFSNTIVLIDTEDFRFNWDENGEFLCHDGYF